MTRIAASLICGNPLYIADELHELEDTNCDYLHMDVMDGIYVNNLALGPEWIASVKKETSIPLDVHLACVNPKKYIDMFADINPEFISFHIEVSENPLELIKYVKEKGIKASLAINPETKIEKIYPYLEYLDMVLVMTVTPGFSGQSFNEIALKKITKLKHKIKKNKNKPLIEVDGNINQKTISLMANSQPDVYVLGTSALFHQKDYDSYTKRINELRKHIIQFK